MDKSEFWRGAKESAPMLLGLVPAALILGAQAVHHGFRTWWVPVMAGTNFAGGSEFTAVGLWADPVNIGLIALMSFLVNSRHIVMGAAFSLLLKDLPRKKVLPLLFVMTDEAWAMGIAEAHKTRSRSLNVPYYLGSALSLYVMWILCTTAGAQLAPYLGSDLAKYGFDMALPAVFLVLLKGMWRGIAVSARPWLVSLAAAGLIYHLSNGAWYVLGGTLAGIAAAFFGERKAGKNAV